MSIPIDTVKWDCWMNSVIFCKLMICEWRTHRISSTEISGSSFMPFSLSLYSFRLIKLGISKFFAPMKNLKKALMKGHIKSFFFYNLSLIQLFLLPCWWFDEESFNYSSNLIRWRRRIVGIKTVRNVLQW